MKRWEQIAIFLKIGVKKMSLLVPCLIVDKQHVWLILLLDAQTRSWSLALFLFYPLFFVTPTACESRSEKRFKWEEKSNASVAVRTGARLEAPVHVYRAWLPCFEEAPFSSH